jgi:hypothetical protein
MVVKPAFLEKVPVGSHHRFRSHLNARVKYMSGIRIITYFLYLGTSVIKSSGYFISYDSSLAHLAFRTNLSGYVTDLGLFT